MSSNFMATQLISSKVGTWTQIYLRAYTLNTVTAWIMKTWLVLWTSWSDMKRIHITHHLWETPNISLEIVLLPQSAPPNWQHPHLSSLVSPHPLKLCIQMPHSTKSKPGPWESGLHLQLCTNTHSRPSASTWSTGRPTVMHGKEFWKNHMLSIEKGTSWEVVKYRSAHLSKDNMFFLFFTTDSYISQWTWSKAKHEAVATHI